MALNDDAVIVAAVGYVFVATPGTASPTPTELEGIDPLSFGSQSQRFKVTGSPTSFTILVGGVATASLLPTATAAQVQAAIEAVDSVGAGNTIVTGVSPADTGGITVTWIGPLQGKVLALTEGTYVAGTTPTTIITQTVAVNGWDNIGHTSRGSMPEFGFDGGKLEMKGTWQRMRLREVQTGNPVEDSVKVSLEQWDEDSLELYFGTNAADTDGIFGVDGSDQPVEKAFLVVIIDGDAKLGFYASLASITRDAAIKLPIDDFASLPIKATFLNLGNRRLYDWISLDLFPGS